MSDWSQIDDLRERVAKAPAAAIAPGPFSSFRDAQEALGREDLLPSRLVALGWEIFLSRRRQGGLVLWHLSTKLHPHGRSATENDWKVLSRIAVRVGAPAQPALLPDDPRAAVHWSWREA